MGNIHSFFVEALLKMEVLGGWPMDILFCLKFLHFFCIRKFFLQLPWMQKSFTVRSIEILSTKIPGHLSFIASIYKRKINIFLDVILFYSLITSIILLINGNSSHPSTYVQTLLIAHAPVCVSVKDPCPLASAIISEQLPSYTFWSQLDINPASKQTLLVLITPTNSKHSEAHEDCSDRTKQICTMGEKRKCSFF